MDKFILFLIEHYFYSVPLLVVSILLIRSNAIKGGKKITPQDLINLTNQDAAQLIDLRSSNEFDDGHITGSINIPYTDLEDRIHEIKKQEDKITKWISEPDKGLYDAMNKGISMATGDIIGILNSDDTFFSNEILADIAKFHLNNSIDASVGNIIQHKEDGKIVRVYSSKYWNPQKLIIGFMPPHPSIFFKRELFNKFGNYELGFIIGADYELITRFFLKENISWKYSEITTTSMLVGGLSSSGSSSYKLITNEIQKALKMNGISFSPFKIKMRFIWKIAGFLKNE